MALLLFSASGCSNLRYLEENEKLYTGSKVNIEKDEKVKNVGEIKSELERVKRPEPNARFLFWRPRLWLYNVAGEPTGRGLRHWMRNRLGRPPVLFEETAVERNKRLMENRLYNMGFFDGMVEYEIREKPQKASVDYTVFIRSPYKFGELHPVKEENLVGEYINRALEETTILAGEPYRLQSLRAERERIDRDLKRNGFFYFNPDFILFRADSTVGDRRVDIHTTIKADIPSAARRQYTIGNVYVFADYLMDPARNARRTDTLKIKEGLYMFDRERQFDPAAIEKAVFLEKGELYNSENHDLTLNHLIGLGVFRFVNLRFVERTVDGQPTLDVRVMLTPREKKSLSAELSGVTKSNNFAGPGVTGSFSNVNFFGGAEHFRLSLNAAYETLISRQLDPASARELGVESELTFPRFILPFRVEPPTPRFVPRTNVSLSLNYMSRTDAFNLTSVRTQFGYEWNTSITTRHRVRPAVFNLFILGTVDENIEDILLEGALLRRGLFEQFIFGSEYSFYYNSQLRSVSRRDWYFNFNVDVSGNLLYLLLNNAFNASPTDDGEYRIFGQGFSQYSRADFDLRNYQRIGSGQRLVTRLRAGAGVPYGNSDYLPYVKQFHVGGSNSVRAFHPRTLGPGAYAPHDTLQGRFNIYQTGDIIMEANVEYRFDITNMIKGALFVDAGNIWRLREDENTPGGEFFFDKFYEQIAIGAGTGLRFDVNFFVLRFDFAFPLAIPYSDTRRFFEPVQPHRWSWLKDNVIFNLAIGYPF